MKTNKKTVQAFYPTLADALSFLLQQLFHSAILLSSSLQHKTILGTLPLPLACSFHLSWGGNTGIQTPHRCCSFFPLESVMLALPCASMFTREICCNADPRAHFTEMDLRGLEWTWEACICTNTPVTLMQVVNEFENHCPKSLCHSDDVAASTFALWNIRGRNMYITIIEEKKPSTFKSNKTEWGE